MRDRREHARYELAGRPPGALRYLSAVEIVSVRQNEYVVVADEACVAGEELVLREASQASTPIAVRISACRPVLVDDRVRFEVRLLADTEEEKVEAHA